LYSVASLYGCAYGSVWLSIYSLVPTNHYLQNFWWLG
jgi:hypothetical protein